MDIEKSIDRRGLFLEAFRLVGRNLAEYVDSKVEEKKTQVGSITSISQRPEFIKPEFRSKRSDYLRPPGAVDESLFLERCKECNPASPKERSCVASCPRGSIFIAGSDYPGIEGTPIIIPRKAPCVLCKDLSCTRACRLGVLTPLHSTKDVRMGTAYINERNCPAYDGVSNCSLCHIRCPLSDLAIYLDDFKPTVNKDLCTGCGVCEHACSTINTTPAIRVRPIDLRQKGSRGPGVQGSSEMLEEGPLEPLNPRTLEPSLLEPSLKD